MSPSPKLPTSNTGSLLGALRPAKPAGAIANPHGESSGPREISRSPSGQAGRAVKVEDVHKAAVRAGHVIMLGGVLEGVGDVDLPVQDLNVERGVAGGQLGSVKAPAGKRRDLSKFAS